MAKIKKVLLLRSTLTWWRCRPCRRYRLFSTVKFFYIY